MKKLAIIATLALAAMTASATDISMNFSQMPALDYNAAGVSTVGVTVNQNLGTFGVQAGYDRSMVKAEHLTRYSVLGTYDFAKIQKAVFTAKAGGAYLDSGADTGYAALVGVGVSYPVAKKVSLTADYTYQYTNSNMSAHNGNMVGVGVKYSF